MVEEGTLFPFAQQTVNEDKILIYMSDKEMKSYRFGTAQEPTDEMLEQIMKEVAQEARESSKKVENARFEQMRRNIAAKQEKWAEQINQIINS